MLRVALCFRPEQWSEHRFGPFIDQTCPAPAGTGSACWASGQGSGGSGKGKPNACLNSASACWEGSRSSRSAARYSASEVSWSNSSFNLIRILPPAGLTLQYQVKKEQKRTKIMGVGLAWLPLSTPSNDESQMTGPCA